MNKPVITPSIIVIWLTHGVIDTITTKALVNMYGLGVEGNPIMRTALHTNTFIILQIVGLTLLTALILGSEKAMGETPARAAAVTTALMGVALVVNNARYLV